MRAAGVAFGDSRFQGRAIGRLPVRRANDTMMVDDCNPASIFLALQSTLEIGGQNMHFCCQNKEDLSYH